MRQGRKENAAELIRQLRGIAQIGIVNHARDTEILLRCADWMEAADERLAILSVELMDEEKRLSGLISEE